MNRIRNSINQGSFKITPTVPLNRRVISLTQLFYKTVFALLDFVVVANLLREYLVGSRRIEYKEEAIGFPYTLL